MSPKPIHVLIASLAVCGSVPGGADVVSSAGDSFVIRSEMTVPRRPLDVWAVLVVPARWWAPEHTWSGKAENLSIDPRATGCFCERLPLDHGQAAGARGGSVEHMRVIHASPGKLLRMAGGLGPLQGDPARGILDVTLTPAGPGTRVVFEYRVAGLLTLQGGQIAAPVDRVLAAQLGRLAALTVAGQAPGR